jgi:hypothetical protein
MGNVASRKDVTALEVIMQLRAVLLEQDICHLG